VGGSTSGFAIVEGALVPLDQAAIPVTDVQVTHGLGVYETLSSEADPGPNLARLAESARAIGVAMPDEATLRAEIARVCEAVGGPSWVRVNLTGDARRLVWATPAEPERRHQPARCARAPHQDSPLMPGSVKSRSRGPWLVELRRQGVDELLFVDVAGRFTEGTSCAVLAVIGGAIHTAPWDGRILRSTTLERLLERAEALGIPVHRLGPPAGARGEEQPWDALYVASTTRGIAPVSEIDGKRLSMWEPVGRALADVRAGGGSG
jgi:branched-subunit amino acid aminotransferase/4-amino-4-deoxychorismate lyase